VDTRTAGANLYRRRPFAGGLLAALALIHACTAPPVTRETAASARERRDAALAAARVWQAPATPVSAVNLRDNPPGAPFSPDQDLECRFTDREVGGTTPKFYCALATGEVVKIKYGIGNPELLAEVAATRLLTALGFWSDQMFVVRSVRCTGCPPYPFKALRCSQKTGLKSVCYAGASKGQVVTFPFAVVERRLEGKVIEAIEDQGWGWYELGAIDAARGGSPQAEVDALRLMAVFLAHWDNKSPNQRLVCPPGAERPDGGCASPRAIMQDLGATFGPLKVDLQNWRTAPIWKDAGSCTVSMEHLPWGGGTFPETRISEEGRQLLLGLLTQLSDAQLRDLFEGSRIAAQNQFAAESRSAAAWVAAFQRRVEQIRDAGPCGAGSP
jgi:hypothetical protein